MPVTVTPYTGPVRSISPPGARYFTINFTHPDYPQPRLITGELAFLTWESRREPCYYVGDIQGGPLYEVKQDNDPVIQGVYQDYEVGGSFETMFAYSHFKPSKCIP